MINLETNYLFLLCSDLLPMINYYDWVGHIMGFRPS